MYGGSLKNRLRFAKSDVFRSAAYVLHFRWTPDMSTTTRSQDEIAQIGQRLYEECIRPHVMPQHKCKFLVLDIDSGDYEIDEHDLAAEDRLRAHRPNGTLYGLRIGYKTAYSFGGGMDEGG
jgi:hypothetical protein